MPTKLLSLGNSASKSIAAPGSPVLGFRTAAVAANDCPGSDPNFIISKSPGHVVAKPSPSVDLGLTYLRFDH